ncbi:MAG: PLP-dependent lyase/thiolase [Ilumatobacter sp.]|nr:PLP-dependent lyase/thiolase [Ilumatobacter sp.]
MAADGPAVRTAAPVWRCAVCGATVDAGEPLVFTCPNRTEDDPYHVLHPTPGGALPAADDDPNPLLRYAGRCMWHTFATQHGLGDDDVHELVDMVGDDFRPTPFGRSEALSAELGLEVWVKEELRGVAGSQKARHLVGTMLHLLAAERIGLLCDRPNLAIASCGNAALAAATLAQRVDWPIDVFVPTWMDPAFGERLDALDARIHRCERRAGDPPGDPAMLRFQEAVRTTRRLPFTVQGPENALCLDTGRTLGWEIADQAATAGVEIGRIVVQVGGGAFASSVGAGLGPEVRLDAVQAEGCAPLAAAWERASTFDRPAAHWAAVMRPWPDPHSAADGILDDETYDWLGVFDAMRSSGGRPVVAAETEIARAHRLATAAGYEVSVTGAAGLAGVLHLRDEIDAEEPVVIVLSGIAR